MNVSVLQKNLAYGLSVVSRAVSARSTLPVLGNILIASDEGRLRLSATNLEMGITCWVSAKIEVEGATTVPARTFGDLVNTLSDQAIALSLDENTQTLRVECGSSHTNVKCISAEEFPPMPVSELSNGVVIQVGDFKEVVQQVAFAASSDDARPILTGVLMQVNGDEIALSATDGFRLSVRKAKLAAPASIPLRTVVPARALSELARIAGDGDETLTILHLEKRNQIVFRLKNIEVVSQLIEGNYPDVSQIIPRNYATRTVLSTQAFLKACKQVEIFAREGSSIARLSIVPGGEMQPGSVEISGQSEEIGSSRNLMDASIDGEAMVIAFNVRFLREVLDVIKTPNVALETTRSDTPGILRPINDDQFLHVIMPMHP
ncbi:MAG: DNA polymerase III subunit beta [Anaerolineales bacterium]